MGQPVAGRFSSRFLLMVIPGVVASAIAVLVLYAVNTSRAPSEQQLSALAPQGDGLSAEERRELTRQMLKERRENPQEPAQVRPTPTLRPSTTGIAEDPAKDIGKDPGTDTKARPERAPAVAQPPAVRVPAARAKVDLAPTVASPTAPTVAAPAATPAQPAAPVTAAAPPADGVNLPPV